MRRSFRAIAVFVTLCLTPTSYARYYDPEYGRFLSRDEMEGKLDNAPSLHRFAYAHGNPLRYTDPTGRCIFQTCTELWSDVTAPEPPASPPPSTPVSPAAPVAPPSFDWGASQDKKMRDRFNDYLYREEPPMTGDAADILQWRQQRTNARGVVKAMETVNDVSHWYLREVAAPYLIAEGSGLGVLKVGGGTAKALARDFALESTATKRLARIEKLDEFMVAQRNAAANKRAEFGGQEAYASANRPSGDLDPVQWVANSEDAARAWDDAAAVQRGAPDLQAVDPARHPTFRPGRYAGDSIPARSTSQTFTPPERAELNLIGRDTGCHTCGTKNPGTRSGNFVPDHQPVSSLAPSGTPQRLFPQCKTCSDEQGLAAIRALQERGK